MDESTESHPMLAWKLDEAVESGAFPAAQACVIRNGEVVHRSAHGKDCHGREVREQDLFDVASVTKMVATTAAMALIVEHGEVGLEDDVRRFLPEVDCRVTVRELLAHGSGLPAWKPLFTAALADTTASVIFPSYDEADVTPELRQAGFRRAREIVGGMARCARVGRDRGKRVYSDIGFILLGQIVAEVAGVSFDRFCAKEVFEPLELGGTGFFDLATPHQTDFQRDRRILATGETRPRKPAPGQESLYKVPEQEPLLDPGQVDDDNAWAMGGVAGHAGLFSTARDLACFGWLLQEELEGAERLGCGETLRLFASPDELTRGARRGLGFDMPADEGSLAGTTLGKKGPLGAIGHLGFTGCSLWLDRDRGLAVSLVSNRVRPGRTNVEGIRAFRPEFHDSVVRILVG